MKQLEREGITPIAGTIAALILTLGANLERADRRNLAHSPLSLAEVQLAEALRALGLAFEQQAPIGRCDADFYFPSQRLVVEVDGKHHEDRWQRDVARDHYFRRLGIATLRIPARDVFRNSAAVADRIWNELARRNAQTEAKQKKLAAVAPAGICDDCKRQVPERIRYERLTLCATCGESRYRALRKAVAA